MSFRFVRVTALCTLLATFALADKKVISPGPARAGANAPLFSPAVLVDGTLYVSGQMGTAAGGIPENFDDEMKQALENVGSILKAADMTFDDVVSVTVYLSDMELFPKMNAVYTTYFKSPRPARTTIGVAKLANAKGHVEITVTAHK